MIIINGNHLQEEVCLAEYLKSNNYDMAKIAVEKNGNIIPKREYESNMLIDGDKVEIVQFVGGG